MRPLCASRSSHPFRFPTDRARRAFLEMRLNRPRRCSPTEIPDSISVSASTGAAAFTVWRHSGANLGSELLPASEDGPHTRSMDSGVPNVGAGLRSPESGRHVLPRDHQVHASQTFSLSPQVRQAFSDCLCISAAAFVWDWRSRISRNARVKAPVFGLPPGLPLCPGLKRWASPFGIGLLLPVRRLF